MQADAFTRDVLRLYASTLAPIERIKTLTDSKTNKDLFAGKSPLQVAHEQCRVVIMGRKKIYQAIDALDLRLMDELKGHELVTKIDGKLDFWAKHMIKTTDWSESADALHLLSGHIARVDNLEERARLMTKFKLLVESQPMLVGLLAAKTAVAEVKAPHPLDRVGIIKRLLCMSASEIDDCKKMLRLSMANYLLGIQALIEKLEDGGERSLLMENHRDFINSLGPGWNELYVKLVTPSGTVDDSSYDRLLFLPEFQVC